MSIEVKIYLFLCDFKAKIKLLVSQNKFVEKLIKMLNIIGFTFIIVFTVFAYKTAKDYERSPISWALISFAVGFSLQIILPVFIIIFIAVVMSINGFSTEQQKEEIPIITISIVGIILSIVSGFLIVRHLANLPEEDSFVPPPPDFNQPE